MSFSNVNIGTSPGDHTGDPLRSAFNKVNDNFQRIASGQVPIVVNMPVTSVAGRTGNITLTIDDIAGGVGADTLNLLVDAHLLASNISVFTNDSSYATTSYANTRVDSLGAVINANVTAANLQITNLWSNAGVQSANIATLTANAGVQADAITALQANLGSTQIWANANVASINANIGSFYTYANLHFADSSFGNSNVAGYLSTQTFYSNTNVEAYFGANIGSLWANAGAQSNSIAGANAAIITANTAMKTYVDNNTSTVTESNTAPTSPRAGALWWDTVSGATFIYYDNAWVDTTVNFTPPSIKNYYTVQYLLAGGGGGGGWGGYINLQGTTGSIQGGSGGAGGIAVGTTQFISGLTYNVTVGSGGIAKTIGSTSSIIEPTTFANISIIGGGAGGNINLGINNGYFNGYGFGAGGDGANGGGGCGAPWIGGPGNFQPGPGGNVITISNYFAATQPYIIPGSVGSTGGVTTGGSGGTNNPQSVTIGNVSVASPAGGAGGATGTVGTLANGSPGSSGVVYITYSSPTQLGTGGNTWSYTQNGYTYWMHQFTSNGTYTA